MDITMADRVLAILAVRRRWWTTTQRVHQALIAEKQKCAGAGVAVPSSAVSMRTVSSALTRLRLAGLVLHHVGIGWKWRGVRGVHQDRETLRIRAAGYRAAADDARKALKAGAKIKLKDLARHGLKVQLLDVRA